MAIVLTVSFFVAPLQLAFAQDATDVSTEVQDETATEEAEQFSPAVTTDSASAPEGDATASGGGGAGESLLSSEDPVIESFDDARLSHESKPEVRPDENTGALRYVFPIVTPPGRNGLGPDLKLVYDSSLNKNEYLGLNWSVDVPYIERINRTGVEDLYDSDFAYFFSSFDGELRKGTETASAMMAGFGGGESVQLSAGIEGKVSDFIATKSAAEKADIKGQEIAKLGSIPRTKRESFDIEVVSLNAMGGGVEVFARAWDANGEQIGFGLDGTVDIERFRVFNPPILVDDPNGDIVREYVDPTTEKLKQRTLREDLQEALLQSLEHTLSVKKERFGSKNIVPGKVGNTTSTFYPEGCTTSTSNDGMVRDDASSSSNWNTVHDYTSSPDTVSSPDNCGSENFMAGAGKAGNGNWRIIRGFFLFDTSGLSDSDTISSATLSLRGSSKFNDVDDGTDWVNVIQSSPASNTTLTNDDYDQAGAVDNPTEGSTRLDLGSWSTAGYNDFALNATGTAWISKTGVTKLGLREGHDALDTSPSTPTPPDNDIAVGYFADTIGSTRDPKLVVEHSGATPNAPSGDYGPLVENGDFRKYEYVDSEWWRVTDKFGTVYKFGFATTTRQNKSDAATTTFKWMLEEVRDTNDNYISYEYHKDNGQIYPYKIKYTGNGSTDGIYEVEFVRTYNPDTATTTSTGFPVKTYYKISEIQVKSQNDWVRKYALSYANGFKNINLLLSSIAESGQDETGASSTLPAYSFEYNAGFSPVWTLDTTYATGSLDHFVAHGNAAGDGVWKDLGTRPIDANGDGYADQIHARSTNKWVNLNNTNKGWNGQQWQGSIPDTFVETDYTDRGLRIIDVDGDGMPDLVKSDFEAGVQATSTYTHTGSGWATNLSYQDIEPIFPEGVRFGDVNGDGLTDFVQGYGTTSRKVYLNKGDETGWAYDSNYTVPIAFINTSKEDVGGREADVNKDGLVDLISASTTGATTSSMVYINKGDGTGWDVDANYSVPVSFIIDGVDQGVRIVDVTNDGYPDLVMSRKNSGSSSRKVYVNNGDGTGWSDYGSVTIPGDFAEDGKDMGFRFMDMTGDGIVDLVEAIDMGATGDRGNIYINSGNFSDTVNYPDSLTRITSALGEELEVKYLTSPLYKTAGNSLHNPNLPLALNTVRYIIRDDGFGTLATTTYEYGNGEYYWDGPLTRKFAGFATTTVTDSVGNKTITYFHQGNTSTSTGGEYNDDFSKIGKPYRVEKYDDGGNLYEKILNKWDSYGLSNNRDYVKLDQTLTLSHDGQSGHRDSGVSYSYSTSTGNLLEKIEYGEVTGSDDGTFTDTGTDKKTTTITYAASTTLHILGLPSREQVFDSASSTVRDTKHYYDDLALGSVSDGNETKTEFWKASSSYASTTRAYNSYGLVTQDTDPRSNTTTYTYDSANLYVATSTNALSQQTQFYYDYSLGKPKEKIDANGREFETVYDAFDRPTEEKQPDLATPSTLVTKKAYAYTDTVGSRKVVETTYSSSTVDFTLYTYLDGLDRPIQTRREAEDTDVFSVRDFGYNKLGLLETESLPYFSSGSAKTSIATTSALFTTYSYDPLKRVTAVANAVGTTSNSYLHWRTTITDPRSKTKKIEKDAFGMLSAVVENNSGAHATTTYAWNHIGMLTSITDAEANVRNFTYDGRGLRLTAQDLHDAADGTYGTWSFAYDDAGNVSSTTDPNGQTIQYTYDALNRVLTEDYTGLSGTEISYDYDDCTEGVERLCVATSTGAVTAYTYNALGLVASETKTINGADYTTSYSYDRQGNLTNIVYPDSSEVKYTYNTAGYPETIERRESDQSFVDVLTDVDYGPTGQVTFKAFANCIESTYTHDANELYRIKNIYTAASSTGCMGGGEGAALEFFSPAELDALLARASSNEKASKKDELGLDDAVAPTETSESETDSHVSEEAIPTAPPEPDEPADVPSGEEPGPDQVDLVEEEALAPTAEGGPDAETDVATPNAPIGEQRGEGSSESDGKSKKSDITSPDELLDEAAVNTPQQEEQSPNDNARKAPPHPQEKVSDAIAGLSARERADIKGQEIAKLESMLRTNRQQVAIEVLSMNPIEGGLEVFARAWDAAGNQIGFGTDGTVEIERFRIFNPPILVDDPNGDIIREYPDPTTGELKQRPLREDLQEALLQSLEHTIAVKQQRFGSENIVAEKVGNTTSTFYPDACTTSTSNDGIVRDDASSSSNWNTVHDYTSSPDTGSSPDNCGTENYMAGVGKAGNGNWRIVRGFFLFDTSAIGDSDTIDSATLSLRGTAKFNDINDGTDWVNVVQSSPASNTALTNDDYDQAGAVDNPTEGSTRLDLSSWSTTGYNDFTLDSTGRGWISKTDISKFGLREGHDATDSAPSTPSPPDNNLAQGYFADQSGTTNDPKLVVEHSAPPNAVPTGPSDLLTEGQTNPSGITDSTPEFSAIYNDADPGDLSPYYRLQVSTSSSFASVYWDSGTTAMATTTQSNRSPDLSYAGSSLASSTLYYWRIKFSDDDGATGDWSTSTATFIIGSGGLQNITYTYDANGNITNISDSSDTAASRTIVYTYDDLNRLLSASTTAATSTPFTRTYAYSSIGNIASTTDLGDYTYGETNYANPHAPTSINSVTYSYDNNGNLTSVGSDTFDWDFRNRLATSTVSATTTTYGYDHANMRVFQAVNYATTTYANKYFSTSTATATKHIFSPQGELVATVTGTGSTTATIVFIHTDHLGGTNVVTDEAGNAAEVTDYYPYGSVRINSLTSGAAEPRKFIGEHYDTDTSLSYLNARYYDGLRGQFISQDPVFWEIGITRDGKGVLTNPQLQNSYSYAGGNPITGKDPEGRCLPVCAALFAPPTAASVLNLVGLGFLGNAVINTTFSFYNNILLPLAITPSGFTPDQRAEAPYRFAAETALNFGTQAIPGTVVGVGTDLILLGAEHLPGDRSNEKRGRGFQWPYEFLNRQDQNLPGVGGGPSGATSNINNQPGGATGGSSLTPSQQQAVSNIINAALQSNNVNIQAFVTALSGFITAFQSTGGQPK